MRSNLNKTVKAKIWWVCSKAHTWGRDEGGDALARNSGYRSRSAFLKILSGEGSGNRRRGRNICVLMILPLGKSCFCELIASLTSQVYPCHKPCQGRCGSCLFLWFALENKKLKQVNKKSLQQLTWLYGSFARHVCIPGWCYITKNKTKQMLKM